VFASITAALLRHRLRTGLTVLGIGIGIAAVICTAAIGAAGTQQIQARFDALGEDFLWIRAGSVTTAAARSGSGGARTLTPDDAHAIEREVWSMTACSPQRQGREQLISGHQNWNTRYQAVWPSFFDIRRRTASAGALFSAADEAAAERVVVVGPAIVEVLFGGEDPVGRTIRMNGFPFKVIGVLGPRGTGRGGVDRDDVVFVPFATADRYLERQRWVRDVVCRVASPELMQTAETQLISLLRYRHRLADDEPNDFEVVKPVETVQMRASTVRTLSWLLAAVGAVSLVVGGVNIMNIMLVSVAERRREIGVRLAVGARVRDIRLQFLAEAALLGVMGGVAGLGLGSAAAFVLSSGFDWPTRLSADAAALAMAGALAVALAFGYYPAHRASRLDPIEAIRAET
jgi:putative ABC transport system permease protein